MQTEAMTYERLTRELPRQIRRTRATLIGEALAEGADTQKARKQSDAAHRKVYRRWLRKFETEHPCYGTLARSILKREGVL